MNEDFEGTILFFHGGGLANGDIDFYTDTCMKMALKLNRRVSVESVTAAHPSTSSLLHSWIATKLRASSSPVNSWTMSTQSISCSSAILLGATLLLLSRYSRVSWENSPRERRVLLYPLVYNDHTLTSMFDSVRENGEDYILTREDVSMDMSISL